MLTESFMIHFSKLEDPRIANHNSRHKFFDIIVMAFIAVLCGCDDWVEVARFCKVKIKLFKELLELPNGIPSHDTFGRVFSIIDAWHFEEVFAEWMHEIFHKTRGEIIALDGKTIRAARAKGNKKGVHMVSAWACQNKLTLASMKVAEGDNEITTIKRILKLLNISKCTVTIDAIGCQKEIAAAIVARDGNYVLCVKDNQKDVRSAIETAFKIVEQRPYKEYTDTGEQQEKAHGRIEARRYLSLPLTYTPYLKDDWAGIQSITKVIRTRTIEGEETTVGVWYYISSHPYLSDKIAEAIRNHWNIENNLHWQLDISFHEDQCRARVKNAAESISLLRKISMAYLKKDLISKVGIKCKRKMACWDDQYLADILMGAYNQDADKACEKSPT
jgi:predicted transposase YbfD/YdcC